MAGQNNLAQLPPPPNYATVISPDQMANPVWAIWFTQLYNRVGGAVTTPNEGLDVYVSYGGDSGGGSGSVGGVQFGNSPAVAPVTPGTPAAWQDVYINGILYKMPLYQ